MGAVRSEICYVIFNWTAAKVILQADQLYKHLYVRMDQRLQKRPPEKYWSRWLFPWARRQFSQVSLIVCLAGHAKKDLDARQVTKTPFFVALQEFIIVEPASMIEGEYI